MKRTEQNVSSNISLCVLGLQNPAGYLKCMKYGVVLEVCQGILNTGRAGLGKSNPHVPRCSCFLKRRIFAWRQSPPAATKGRFSVVFYEVSNFIQKNLMAYLLTCSGAEAGGHVYARVKGKTNHGKPEISHQRTQALQIADFNNNVSGPNVNDREIDR